MDITKEIEKLNKRMDELKALAEAQEKLPVKPVFKKYVTNYDKLFFVEDMFDSDGEYRKGEATCSHGELNSVVKLVGRRVVLTESSSGMYQGHHDINRADLNLKKLTEEECIFFGELADKLIDVMYEYKVKWHNMGNKPIIKRNSRESEVDTKC